MWTTSDYSGVWWWTTVRQSVGLLRITVTPNFFKERKCAHLGNPHLAFISDISSGPAFQQTADFVELSRKWGLNLHSMKHSDLITTKTKQSQMRSRSSFSARISLLRQRCACTRFSPAAASCSIFIWVCEENEGQSVYNWQLIHSVPGLKIYC